MWRARFVFTPNGDTTGFGVTAALGLGGPFPIREYEVTNKEPARHMNG